MDTRSRSLFAALLVALLALTGCTADLIVKYGGADPTLVAAGPSAAPAPAPVTHKLGNAASYAYPVGPAGGDLSGTYPNPTVAQASAATGNWTWAPSVSAPKISVATPLSDVATVPLLIQSQAPFAGAVTNVKAGNIVYNIPASISGSAYGATSYQYAGTTIGQIAALAANPTVGALMLGGSANSLTTYTMLGDGTNTVLNALTGGGVYLRVNNTSILEAISTGLVVSQSAVQFANTTTPAISEAALASTSAGNGTAGVGMAATAQGGQQCTGASCTGGAGGAFTLSSGPGGTGTSANGAPGAVNLNVSGTSGTNQANVNFQNGGATFLSLLESSSGASSQFTLPSSLTNLVFNATNAGQSILLESPSGNLTLTSSIISTIPTIQWGSTVTNATLTQQSTSTQTQGASMTATPQQSTQATNQGGGSYIVALQTPLGTGGEASFQTTRGGTVTNSLSAIGSAGALYQGLGATAQTNTNYTVESNGTNGVFNAPSASGSALIAVGGTGVITASPTAVTTTKPVAGQSGTNAFSWFSGSVALTSGASNVLTSAQYYTPHIKFTGALTGAGTTVTFPATDGACWDLDFSAVTTITDSISLIANGVTWGTAIAVTTNDYPHICYSAGAGRLVGVLMTQWAVEGSAEDWAAWGAANDNSEPARKAVGW